MLIGKYTIVVTSLVLFILGAISAPYLPFIQNESSQQSQFVPTEAFITSVVDGDTVVLEDGSRVRYLGLDTPETFGEPECGGEKATSYNRMLVEGKRAELYAGPENQDQCGRLIRYVFVDGVFVNAELLYAGMAKAQSFHPDEKYRQIFTQLAWSSQQLNRGLWSECNWE